MAEEPILREKAQKVEKIDEATRKLSREMRNFLARGDKGRSLGLGLAAPQIGISQRIMVIRSGQRYLVMINPEIIWHSRRTRGRGKKSPLEGCLSLPGFYGKVLRCSVVKVRYLTADNAEVTRRFRRLTASVIQHEIDHLEGILFIDRIVEQGGKIYKAKKTEGKTILEEMKIHNENFK